MALLRQHLGLVVILALVGGACARTQYAGPKHVPIHLVDSEPRVLTEVKIRYPEQARLASIQGTVILFITINAKGDVVAAKIVSGPSPELNEAALAAIKRFRFKPAIKDGEAVSTEMKYAYAFVLN